MSNITINIKGPSELKLSITISLSQPVSELKKAIASQSEVEAERQRLIYSGRVLKDDDLLESYKIQDGHTVHMVKGAAKSGSSAGGAGGAATAGSGSGTAPQALPNMQTGQNVHDPLTTLNGHQGFGAMAGLNPFANMGINQNDPNMLQTMMSSPEFLQQMSGALSNPAVLDQIIASDPRLASAGPQIRQYMQSDAFRNMLSNPQQLQSMLQMSQMMNQMGGEGGGLGGLGGFGGGAGNAFPAPGVPGQPQGANPASPNANNNAQANPFGNLFGGGGAGGIPPPNPEMLAALFGGGGAGAGAGAAAGGANPWGGMFGAPSSTPAAPADTRSPEERFSVQLEQLQGMGFTSAQQNVRALLATAGNVHAAIEYILGGGGI